MMNKSLILTEAEASEPETVEPEQVFWAENITLIRFITPGMLAVIAVIVTIVSLNFESLVGNFKTNIPLNGLIIFIIVHTLATAIWNNYKLWRSAHYLKEVDSVTAKNAPTKADVAQLKEGLNGSGWLYDLSNMSAALDNIDRYGILKFNDQDARLIKSKVGFRVRMLRGNVGFMAGILVMLGLLGTFWGLLATIDAVGEAMGSMSSIGDDPSGDGMTNFMTSLAAPLQGMGLAFSSSLFGLAGSLLIGFFNHLCGETQNKFIENVSRWVDRNIPSPTTKSKGGAKPNDNQATAELKAWLAGFAEMSVKTHRSLNELSAILSQSIDNTAIAARNSESFCQNQKETATLLKRINTSIDHLTEENIALGRHINQGIEQQKEQLTNSNKTILASLDKSTKNAALSAHNTRLIHIEQKSATETLEKINENMSSITTQNQKLGQFFINKFTNNQYKISAAIETAQQSLENVESSANQSATHARDIHQEQKNIQDILENINKNLSSTHNDDKESSSETAPLVTLIDK